MALVNEGEELENVAVPQKDFFARLAADYSGELTFLADMTNP